MSILGTKLKQIREEKGIPLEFIYNKSRVPVSTLQKIEKNEFQALPAAYLGSFIKSYGKEIGLKEDFLKNCIASIDNDQVIETLFNNLNAKTISAVHNEEEPEGSITEKQPENEPIKPQSSQEETVTELPTSGEKISVNYLNTMFHSYKWIVAGAAGILILTLGIWHLINDGRIAEPTNAQPMTFDQVVTFIEKDTLSHSIVPVVPVHLDSLKIAKEKQSVSVAQLDSSGFEYGLSITALKDSVWIGIQPLNKPNLEVMLAPGKSILRKATRFTVTIGKVEQVKVLVNQKPIKLPKTEGPLFNYVIDQEQLRKASRGIQ